LGAVAAIELPIGDTMGDSAAMYRGIAAGLPVANGNSGYPPPHYRSLVSAIATKDDTALEPLAANGPIVAIVDRAAPGAEARAAWLRSSPVAREMGSSPAFTWFLVRPTAAATPVCAGDLVAVAAARDQWGPMSPAPIVDRDPRTFWTGGDAPQAGDF